MRHLLWIGALVLLVIASAGALADDKAELNSELNSDLDGSSTRPTAVDSSTVGVDTGDLQDGAELSGETGSSERTTRALGKRRGRQARRGQTVIDLSAEQTGKGKGKGKGKGIGKGIGKGQGSDESSDDSSDAKSGKSADEDEDEDGETPVSN